MTGTKNVNYNFTSVWHINSPLAQAEAAIQDVANWPRWWPSLTTVNIQKETTSLIGSEANLSWRAALGYMLQLQITITERKPGSKLAFTSEGDLTGGGEWLFVGKGSQTAMTINWRVSTTKPWMNLLAPLLKPVFIASHHKVMRDGEKGLNELYTGHISRR